VDPLRVELVLGFLIVVFFLVPLGVVKLIERLQRPESAPVKLKPAESTGRACPFCKDEIATTAVRIECATCGTWHHATCFEENGGCAVFGCKEKRGIGRAEERRA
jgi:hypothetical protein